MLGLLSQLDGLVEDELDLCGERLPWSERILFGAPGEVAHLAGHGLAQLRAVSTLISSSLAPRSSAALSASWAARRAALTLPATPSSSMVTANARMLATTSRSASSVRAASSWDARLRRPR